MLKVGLIVNPMAGIGGAVGLKGSDGQEIREKALALGATPLANEKSAMALSQLKGIKDKLQFFTCSGAMGEDVLHQNGFEFEVVYQAPDVSEAIDTRNAVKALVNKHVDILCFAGGDGTARDVYSQIPEYVVALGIPAGCKIHSGVYSLTPKSAGKIIHMMATGELVSVQEADVMDIDESAFRDGVVKAKRFGEMQVPSELRYMQAVKVGGKESDELVLQDIAAHVIDEMEEQMFIMGSGSTVAAIMEELGLENTLLGVDLIQDQQVVEADASAQSILNHIKGHEVKLVITLIGGQGHIFGRGNHQLSPDVLKAVGKDNIIIVATKQKLQNLNGKPLIIDTPDPELNKALVGLYPVVTGYKDYVMYRAESPGEE